MKKLVLPNGLTILAANIGLAPKVLVQIAYDVGSSIEQEGERGLAHLLEHMIFKGTDMLAEGDIDGIARKYGATFNAFTSYDMTSYYFEADKNNWEHFLPVLADCMKNARFDDEHLASEVKAVIQELRMYNDSYWHLMFEHSGKTMYPANHPYHNPIIGYKEDLLTLSGKRLKAFYDKYYHPSRAVLVIAGDIDEEAALAQAEQYFKAIPRGGTDHTPHFPQLRRNLMTTSATIYRDVQSESVGLFWRIPGLSDLRQEATFSALEYILGGSLSSRLYRLLVDELRIAHGVQVGSEQFVDSGIFLITFNPAPGKKEECIAVIKDTLHTLISDGVESSELYKMAKDRRREYLQWFENLQHFAYNLIELFFTTGDENTIFSYGDLYDQITPHDIGQLVGTWLSPDDVHVVSVHPLDEHHRGIWQEEQAKEEAYYTMLLEKYKRTTPLEEPKYVGTTPAPKPLAFDFPKPDSVQTLPNGLELILHSSDKARLMSCSLLFRDSAYFSRALDGVTIDVMTSMLNEQTQTLDKRGIADLFERHGAQYSFSQRGVTFTCVPESFDAVLAHTLQVLTQPKFMQEDLDKLKEIYTHSYKRRKDSSTALAMKAIQREIFGKNHPYGATYDEMIARVAAVTLADIQEAYTNHVAPAHFVCAVAGNFDHAVIGQKVSQAVKSWIGASYTPPVYPAPQASQEKTITLPLLRDQVVLAYGRVCNVGLTDDTSIALDLLSHITFNSLGSRIFQLREQTGLFYSASGWWGYDIHQTNGIDFMFTLVNPENVTYTDEKIIPMMRDLAAHGVTQKELDAARQLYLKGLIDSTTTASVRAALLANLATLGLPYDYYDHALAYANAITVEQLNRIARDYVSMDHMVKVIVGRVA